MSERIVTYDFAIETMIAVEAPYGTDPDALLGQVLIKLIQQVRQDEIDWIDCENTYDAETGSYEKIPDEWYRKEIEDE
jgi:hypothetical protein